MNPSAIWYFECVDLYNILCPHKVKEMNQTHTHIFKKYRKGQRIYSLKDDSTHIYLIAEGQVRIGHYLSDGQEVTNAILVRGEIFGELALAGEERRNDFALAEQDTTACTLSIQEMQQLMYKDRELNFKIIKLIGLRLMKVERKLESLVFKDARTRIVEFLKDAAAWKGMKAGYETIIYTKFTHKDIATLTGTSRQTVTTVLNDLQEKKFLNFDRRRILIHDLENLK